jgi:hypothetical protein
MEKRRQKGQARTRNDEMTGNDVKTKLLVNGHHGEKAVVRTAPSTKLLIRRSFFCDRRADYLASATVDHRERATARITKLEHEGQNCLLPGKRRGIQRRIP